MKDAFGGAFMIRIFLIFVLIYILFTALAVNYAKAYKVKELVIAYLEDNKITELDKMTAATKQAMLDYFNTAIVGGLNYAHPTQMTCLEGNECLNLEDIGISIVKYDQYGTYNKLGVYYKVTTYFGYEIGFLKLLKAGNSDPETSGGIGNWQISGETSLIVGK